MKSFRKITSLALAFAMIITSMVTTFSLAAAITFEDVTETTAYSQAIYNLVEEGIINGYDEDGKKLFKPDATITRAEFSKVLSIAKEGSSAYFGQTTTTFPDMVGSEWAIPYVAHASGAGIIKGYEDGTFGPKKPVTYAEAVTMIVRALGYEPVVDKTLTPWYEGYIKMANQIGVTKGAGGIADKGAPRGLVAQLCNNMLGCQRLVQTGVDEFGNAKFETTDDEFDKDTEEAEGVVTAIFGNSLRGSDDSLTKSQIKIDGDIYAISDEVKAQNLSAYLGKNVKFTYTGSLKYTVTSIRLTNDEDELVITSEQLHSASLSEIQYYKDPENDNKTTNVNLDGNLYVVYNGVGVPKASITAAFASSYMNGIETGDITLSNNDSDSAYDIAYINNYKTYFVSAPTSQNGVTTIYDQFSFEPKLDLDEDDVTVTKVSTAGGSASSANVTDIYTKNVVSVAAPLTQTYGTKVVISTATVSGVVTSMDGYDYVEIGGKEYSVSPYFRKLIAADPANAAKYGFDISSNIKCYLDFQGRIVCTEVKETTDPYGYLANVVKSSVMSSEIWLKIFTYEGKWLESSSGKELIKVADRVRVDGQPKDATSLPGILSGNAIKINEYKGTDYTKNATYAQVVKYRIGTINGATVVTDLYTVAGGSESSIVPYPFSATGGTKAPYIKGTDTLKYSKSAYTFSDNAGNTQFAISPTSTVVFVVPGDRTTDYSKYKKRTYTNFSDASYIVEPYEVPSNSTSARVVVQYVADDAPPTNVVEAYTNVSIVVDKTRSKNPDTGMDCHKVIFRNFGSESDTSEYYTSDLTTMSTMDEGDLVKYTLDGKTIEDIKLVYSENTIYESDGTTVASDNIATATHNDESDYYYAIMGTVNEADLDESGAGRLTIIPGLVVDNGDGTFSLPTAKAENLVVKADTKYYEYDSTNGEVLARSHKNLVPALGNTYPETASKVVLIRINKEIKGIIYIK